MIASNCPKFPELVELAALYVTVVEGSVEILLTTTKLFADASLNIPE